MKLKTVFYVGIAVSAGVFGICKLHAYLFPPTDDAEVNAKLLSLKRGESIALADVLGETAERICMLHASYSYRDVEDYVGMLIGAKVLEAPYDLSDGDSPYRYVFVRSFDKNVRYIRPISLWGEDQNQDMNWCAAVKDVQITKHIKGRRWSFDVQNIETYDIPNN